MVPATGQKDHVKISFGKLVVPLIVMFQCMLGLHTLAACSLQSCYPEGALMLASALDDTDSVSVSLGLPTVISE